MGPGRTRLRRLLERSPELQILVWVVAIVLFALGAEKFGHFGG